MLQQISWSDYWEIIVILTVLYECAIVALFYRKEIVLLAKRKRLVLPIGRATVTNDTNALPEQGEDDENLIPFAHELAESVKALIGQAGNKGYAKEELFFGLQQRIKDYPQLKNTRYQREVNTVIMVECKNKCTLHLRAGELDKLWLS